MDFWDAYIDVSLQNPWVIGPEATDLDPLPEPDNHKIFVIENSLPDELFEMISKMVQAIKYQPEEVSLLAINANQAESIKDWKNSKKILFFGKTYPGSFGQFINWYGHKALQTYSLLDLKTQPELKKQTWEHLKNYAKLK